MMQMMGMNYGNKDGRKETFECSDHPTWREAARMGGFQTSMILNRTSGDDPPSFAGDYLILMFSAPNQRLASSKASVGVWSSSIWMPWSRGFSNPSPGLWLEEACRSWRKWPANVGQDPRSAWMIVRCWEMRCPMNPKLGSGRWMKNGPNGWG